MTDLLTPAPAAPVPLVGRQHPLDQLIQPLKFARDPFVFMRNLKETYGDIVSLDGAVLKYTFVFSPEYSRQVLSNPTVFHNGEVDKLPFRVPPDSAIWRLSRTLNAINGDKHRQQRRLMMPAFHRKRVDAYHATMLDLIEKKVSQWQPGQTYDMFREMKQVTLAVAVKTLLGLDPDREGDQTRRLVEDWLKAGASIWAILLPFNRPGFPFHRLVTMAEGIEAEFKALIERKRHSDPAGDGEDVLSMLLHAHDEDGSRLSDQELVAQTLALFVAGHETTATALTWTMFLLSQHPRVMADLLDELEGKLRGGAPSLEQLGDLPMLENVIKESMRVLSPFLWGFRMTTASCEIGPHHLEPGRLVAFAPAIIHHDPAIYPDPRRFQPGRWEHFEPSTYEYMPFAAGPRTCIGVTFAMLEMKIALAAILQRFRLELAPGSRIDRAGFLLTQPRQGLPVIVRRQDRHFVRNAVRGNINQVVKLD